MGRRWANLSYTLVLVGLIIRALFYNLEISDTPLYPFIAGLFHTGGRRSLLRSLLKDTQKEHRTQRDSGQFPSGRDGLVLSKWNHLLHFEPSIIFRSLPVGKPPNLLEMRPYLP